MPFSPIEEIIVDIKAGKMVIVCDDATTRTGRTRVT
jgi:hypothetical protein